jgi:alpha-galactosidase
VTVTHTVWEPYATTGAGGDAPRPVRVGTLGLLVTGECRTRELAEGVVELELTGRASGGGVLRIEWRLPCVDATAYWTPTATDGLSWLPAAWAAPQRVSPAHGAPVGALVGVGDVGICTFAAQAGAPGGREVSIGAGVVEETGEFRCWVQAEAVGTADGAAATLTVRIDTSRRHFGACLAEVVDWWREAVERSAKVHVPDEARLPAYSTWYAMHQHVTPEAVEQQAALGRELGLATVIVDDGWMTGDRGRGYGHCGDWDPVSLPGTAAHVRRVQASGLRYLLWFALPFVGVESAVWEAFQPYALARADALNAIVVDPRYPAVRAHLADRLARPVEAWGMDGLKIDFIDRFQVADPPEPGPDADCASVAEGVELLLAEIRRRISAVSPHAMIETRQPYVSPALWPYATMIRAVDCPLGPAENRRRTVDARLVAGPLAVHADMLMWHPAESAEQLACHLVNVLFAVPQISVDLGTLGAEHRETLAFWLGVFRERADLLQRGDFRPSRPDLGYPTVRSTTVDAVAVARYAALPVDASGEWRELLIANADPDPLVHLVGGVGEVHARVRDARGRSVGEADLDLAAPDGARLFVPRGGLATLTRSATVDLAAR